MSGNDQEDFAPRRASDIVAQSIGNLGVQIADQVDNLDVNIAAQVDDLQTEIRGQVGNLDVNLADQVGNVDITLQDAVDTVNTNISGQVNDLSVDLAAQTINNLDINFASQVRGVATEKEFNAQLGPFVVESGVGTVPSTGSATLVSFTNNGFDEKIIEEIFVGLEDTYQENMFFQFVADTTGNGVGNLIIGFNPAQAPLSFDPGAHFPANASAEVQGFGQGGSSTDVRATVRLRDP
jgi:hypothetical protein